MIMTWGNNKEYQEELMEMCHLDISYEKLQNQRILITGANGLIASYLTDALIKMNEVLRLNMRITALARSKEKARKRFADYLDQEDFELLVGDVCQQDLFKGHTWDYIVHAAGNAHPKAFATQPVETMKANLVGTMNILDYAVSQEVQNKVKKIVFLSSGEIYGETVMTSETGWIEENIGMVDSMNIRACYPESKRAAETLCLSYYNEYSICTIVARLSYIYGATVQEENMRADAQFLRNALMGEDIVMKSEGKQLRSYCYVQDAVEGILLLMLEGKEGEAYNVANNDSNVTIRQYAECLAEVFGVGIRMELPDHIEKTGYSKMQCEVLDATKLCEIGWKPKNGLRDGMRRMKNILKYIES